MSIFISKIGAGEIEKAVFKALDGLNYFPKQEKILIKPNIVNEFKPQEPYITNYRVVKGIILYLQDKGFKDITVGEAPINRNTGIVFSMSGYKGMCDSLGVKLIDLETAPQKKVTWKFGEISLPELVFLSEYINVPKLKTHIQTTVTLGLKNQKGLLGLATKRRFHQNLHENIAQLALCIKPALTVVDAIDGVEGNGPGRMGQVVSDINLIIAGTKFLAVDAVTSTIMGFNPAKIKHLAIAKEIGLGEFDDEILGERIEEIKMHFSPPTNSYKLFNIHYYWDDKTCSGCSGILGDLKRKVLKNPYYLVNLFFCGFLSRLDLLMGNIDNLPFDHGVVVCVGNCAQKAAERYKGIYIPGCPPNPEEILKKIKPFWKR